MEDREKDFPMWMTNILARFDNSELKSALEKWAIEHGCTISWSTDFIELFITPFFVAIFDRYYLDKDGWEDYLDFIEACKDKKAFLEADPLMSQQELEISSKIEPLIVIDSKSELNEELPVPAYRYKPDEIQSILKTIEMEYNDLQKYKEFYLSLSKEQKEDEDSEYNPDEGVTEGDLNIDENDGCIERELEGKLEGKDALKALLFLRKSVYGCKKGDGKTM